MSREAEMSEGPGERAEETRRRRFWLIIGGFMLFGGVLGAASHIAQHAGTLPPPVAIGIAGLIVFGLGGASWYFLRQVDEVELRDNYVAATVAVYFYMLVYPAWYLLWKGGVIGEPRHETVFVATATVLALSYFWKKIRP